MLNLKRAWILCLFLGLSSAAFGQTESNCGDGVDNDNDGFIDCYDGDCANQPECEGSYIGNDKSCQIPQPPGSDFRMKLTLESDVVTTTHGRFVIGDLGDPINGKDGIPELVTAHATDQIIYILDGRTLEVKYQGTTLHPIQRYDIGIADVSNSGCGQIFLFEKQSINVDEDPDDCGGFFDPCEYEYHYFVSSYDCEANLVWREEVPGMPFTLAFADFDADGAAEIYFKNQIMDAATGAVHIAGTGDWSELDSGPVAVDVLDDAECADCDGLELVLGGEIYSVNLNNPTAVDGGTLTLIKEFNNVPGLGASRKWTPKYLNLGGDQFVNSQTSIADFDLDGYLDVLFTGETDHGGEHKTTIFYWNVRKNQGDVFRPGNDWKYGAGRLNLADLDGDTLMNVAFVTGNRIYALDEDLDELWYVNIDENSSGYTSTTVFDFNNDGASEIVYRDESSLYIIRGDGTFSPGIDCRSLTSNDYPIVADVDADGSTEICVVCQEDDDGNIYNDSDDGVIRMYESDNEPWVSARTVWNQHGYFNVNVNDDLTIPAIQQKHHLSFSEGACSEGSNRVLNSFLNQSAILDSDGCKTFATADVAFEPDPDLVNITPPTCPDEDFIVSFTVKNIGDVPLTGLLPISFYSGDPTQAGADHLKTVTISLSNLEKGDTAKAVNIAVQGTGGAFTLYAVLNDAGTTNPLALPNTPFSECNYVNNMVSASVNPVPFTLSSEVIDHIQCGTTPTAANGTAEVYKLEGTTEETAGYTFHWFDGATAGPVGSADFTGAVRSPLNPGTYTAYAVHDAFACSSDTIQVVVGQENRNITATLNVLHDFTNCFVPDGELEVIPDGGLPIGNFTYAWFEGTLFGTSPILSTSNTLTGAEALTYSVLITEKSSSCETLVSGTVPDQTTRPVVAATATSTTCDPDNTGTASADVGGTTTGYAFLWYDGAAVKPSDDHTGATYTALTAGDYTVVAVDNTTGCESLPFVVAVDSPDGITASATITAHQTSCASTLPNGAATADVGGTTAGYTFKWFAGDNTLAANEIGNTASITGLAAGEYTVEATEVATGCTDSQLIEIEDQILTPTVTPSVVANQSSCDPANGEVTATAAGTPGPHVFYWFDGNIATPDTTVADFKGDTYANVVAGFYTVVAVNNDTRCFSTRGLVEVVDNTVDPVVTASSTDQTNCDPATPNGTATADVGGATAGYRFRWFAGTDTTTFITEAISLSGRAAGSYTVKAIDIATGCFGTALTTIDEVAQKPVLSLAEVDNTICDPSIAGTNYVGSVTASFDANPNALPGHTFVYTWLRDGATMTGETDFEITGLDEATYSVTVLNDDLDCESDPVSVDVDDVGVDPVLTTAQIASTNCTPSTATPNGVAEVVTVDGTAVASATGYTYQWHTGVDDSSPIAVGVNPSADDAALTNVQGGATNNYTVSVVNDATGCKALATVLVADLSEKPVVTLAATNNGICDPVAAGVAYDGSVEVATITYKGNPYTGSRTYHWFDGTDTSVPNNTSTTSELADLNGGDYAATVSIDSLGCESDVVTVPVNNVLAIPQLTTSSLASTNCDPDLENGSAFLVTVDATPVAGATGYTYQWHDGAGTASPIATGDNPTADEARLDGIQGGATRQYTVEVLNTANGCPNTATVSVGDASENPVITLAATDNTICDPSLIVPGPGDYDGSVQVVSIFYKGAPYGGTSTLTYQWFDGVGTGTPNTGSTGATLAALDDATYSATVTIDDLGCESDYVSADVADDFAPLAISTAVDGSDNCTGGPPDGSAVVTGVTPVGPVYEYRWYAGIAVGAPGSELNGNPLTDLGIGAIQGGVAANHTVEVTSQTTGCKNTATVIVPDDSEKPVIASLNKIDNINCVGPNGTASIPVNAVTYRGSTINNPYAGFTILWSGAAETTPSINGKGAGNYSVRITHVDDNCTSDPVSVTILDDLTYPVVNTTVTAEQTSCDPLQPNGQLTATSGAGTTFEWFKGIGVGTPVTETATDGVTVPELESDDYTVRATITATGCKTIETEVVPENIVLPVAAAAATLPVTQCANPDGEIEVTPTDITSTANGDFTVYYLKQNTTDATTVKNDPLTFSSSLTTDLTQTEVGPGYWAVLVADEITHCESQVVTVQVDDNTTAANISINAITKAGFCNVADGGIDLNVAGNAPFGFKWYVGGPTNAGPYDYIDDEDGTYTPTFNAAEIHTTEDLTSVFPLFYTVEVTDANGCGTVFSEMVPYRQAPRIAVSKENSTQCDVTAGDGSVFTQLVGFGPYTINLYRGLDIGTATFVTTSTNLNSDGIDNDGDGSADGADTGDDDAGGSPLCTDGVDNDGDGDTDSDDPDCDAGAICSDGVDNDSDGLTDNADPDCDGAFIHSVDYNVVGTLDPGDYLVEIIDHDVGCNVYKSAIIEVDPLDPVVTLGNINANQACDLTVANGDAEITVEIDPNDPRNPATLQFVVTNVDPAVAVIPALPAGGTATFTVNGLRPEMYEVEITEQLSGCVVERSVNIPDNPAIPTISVAVTDETYCSPETNGSAVATTGPELLSEYDFSWYDDAALANPVIHAGTGAAGQTIDGTIYTLGANGEGAGNKTFYVRAQQTSGAGEGCFSPVVQAVIQDKHTTPELTLSSMANTSCDPTVGEGSISVTTATASGDAAIDGATYSYALDGSVPVTGQSGAPANPYYMQLPTGTYTIRAVNETSGCAVSKDIDVVLDRYAISITQSTVNDKLICFPDGDIAVQEITIDRTLKGLPQQQFTASLATDFEFRWFKNAPGSFTSGTPLEDPGANVIDTETLVVGASPGEYSDPSPTLGAGVYYVVGRQVTGAGLSGAFCETEPLMVVIEDESVDPVVTLTAFSNTSCDPALPEGVIEVDITDASGPGPFGYTYAWSSTTGSTPPNPLANPYDGLGNPFLNVEEGTYQLVATNTTTGCSTTTLTTVEPNSTPIFVQDVTSLPQLICPAGGSLEVTDIVFHERDGTPNATAPLSDFTFTWYRGGTAAANELAGATTALLDNGNYATIGADDDYYVVATRTANAPGRDCSSAPFRVAIADERVYPAITLTPFSNTSCDVTLFEGEIQVNVTDASVVAPGTYTYDYTWTALTAGRTAPAAVANPYDGSGPDNLFTAVQDGTYQLQARNTVTGCASLLQTTVAPNTTPIFIQTVASTPQELCGPDGTLSVSQVSYNDRNGVTQNVFGGGLGDFTFTWYRGGTSVADQVAAGGTLLNSGIYAAIEADDDYYVVATRVTNSPGRDCSSAPYRVEIEDERQFPTLDFATVVNTSCDTNYDGEIEVAATTTGLGAGGNYSFDWAAPSLADNMNTAGPHTVTGVQPGTYTITVTNLVTQCATTGTSSVAQNTPTIGILGVTKVDQRDCAPFDGSITVDAANPAHVTVPGTYTFAWAKGTNPLATPTPDNVLAGLDAGTYFVTATKTDNFGSGCVSSDFMVVIDDLTQRPNIELVNTANFACVAPFNGEIAATIVEGTTPGVTAGYSYQWFTGNGTTTPIVGQTNNTLATIRDGGYTVEVVDQATPNLGCVSVASTTLAFAPTIISGEILPTMQTLCAPTQNGSLEVETIDETISGVTTTYDMAVPADLSRYTFQWFDEAANPIAGFTTNVLPNRIAGTYHLQIVNDLGCESTFSTSVILDENAYPAITLDDYLNPTLCVLPEGPGHLQVSADGSFNFSNYTFEWFAGPDATGTQVQANNPGLSNIMYSDPMEYTVRVTNLSTNCVSLETFKLATDTLDIRVLASAVPLNSCTTNNGSLFASVQEGNGNLFNYEWYAGTSVGGTPDFTTKEVLTAPLGVFTVIAVNPNHSFCNSIPATTEVLDGRVYPVVAIAERSALTFCDPAKPNGVARATVNGQINGYIFDWYEGADVTGTHLYTGAELSGLTDITYTAQATDQVSGCTGTQSITITNDPVQVPSPVVEILSHRTHCVNPNGALAATVDAGWNYSIQWYDGGDVKGQTDADGDFYYDLDAAFYTTTVTDLVSGCVSDPVVTEVLEMLLYPEFTIETVPTNCESDVGAASFVATNDVPIALIEWDIFGMKEYGPKVINLPKGSFEVTVVSTEGCEASQPFEILPEILVFNGISQNGDGENDFFEISCIQDFPNNSVKIFNRAGTLVYQAKGYDNQDIYFDGNSNEGFSPLGTRLPEGTYFYIIDKGNGSKPQSGYLELLRQ